MKRYIPYLVVAALLPLGVAAAAYATPPDSPPGQGECEHGNSGQECKPDPQPGHGQDCDEHGPKEGGVNEDHCLPPTTTVPTTTVPTTTVPTTSTPTTTTPTETTTPTGMRCPPGQGPFQGKDGQPGNQECCPDQDNNQQCDATAPPQTPVAGETATATAPTAEGEVVSPAKAPSAPTTKPQPKPPVVITKTTDSTGKPVIVKRNTQTGVVQVKRPGGTYVTATQGSG